MNVREIFKTLLVYIMRSEAMLKLYYTTLKPGK